MRHFTPWMKEEPTDKVRSEFKLLLPNLDRRPDRFLLCVGVLIGQGTPQHLIDRHIACDGAKYKNSVDVASEAKYKYGATLPIYGNGNYITEHNEGWDAYNYSYCRTYYEAWNKIALEPDDSLPTLLLQDDWRMKISYSDICAHIEALPDSKIIQYVGCVCDPEGEDLKHESTEVPNIQRGLSGTGDQALLMMPAGARRLVEFADENTTHTPEMLLYYFAHNADQTGCYSVIENQADHLYTHFTSVFQDRSTNQGGVTTPWNPDTT